VTRESGVVDNLATDEEDALRLIRDYLSYLPSLVSREDIAAGNSKLQALVRIFSGALFEEITPEYYNLHGSGTNIISLARFDTDKRRALAAINGPLAGNPQWRYRVGADFRNENWTVQTSFTGPSTFLGATNLRRESVAAEITRFVGARWTWTTGVEISHRDFRNVVPGVALTPELVAKGYQIKQKAQFTYELWRSPEKRLVIFSGGNSQGSHAYLDGLTGDELGGVAR